MKNYKLDVVRYNNEDVIVTSGEKSVCNESLNGNFYFITSERNGDEQFAEMWAYVNGECVLHVPNGALAPVLVRNTTLEKGHYYHNNEMRTVECLNPESHNLPSEIIAP